MHFAMINRFNPEQQAIIDLNHGWHSCLASAGSGKTEILTERVYRAVQGGVDPKRMLCLTFTNRSAIGSAAICAVLCAASTSQPDW